MNHLKNATVCILYDLENTICAYTRCYFTVVFVVVVVVVVVVVSSFNDCLRLIYLKLVISHFSLVVFGSRLLPGFRLKTLWHVWSVSTFGVLNDAHVFDGQSS